MATQITRTGPGLKKVQERLGRGATYLVGYEAEYAVHVHEDVEMKLKGLPRPSGIGEYWGPHGQAKFLETPGRRNAQKYAEIVRQSIRQGKSIKEATKLAALELLRDSQELVPVEYGNLRASGFVQEER